MTEKSDTQTNPKTQPLYFMTWDEVEEGQKVLLVGATHTKLTDGIDYTRKGSCLTYKTVTNKEVISPFAPEKYKYIPVPQDRPKPNIWDEYTDGDYFEITTDCLQQGYIHKDNVIKNKDYYEAKAAWFKHILDGE